MQKASMKMPALTPEAQNCLEHAAEYATPKFKRNHGHIANEVLCVHVFVTLAKEHPEVLRNLLGTEIRRLPKRYAMTPTAMSTETALPEWSYELRSLFQDDSPSAPAQLLREYCPRQPYGLFELGYLVVDAPTVEICDILVENNLPNDLNELHRILYRNVLVHLAGNLSDGPHKHLAYTSSLARQFTEFMESHLFGQREAIAQVASALQRFWWMGNQGKPMVFLLLGENGVGITCFQQMMQNAFIQLGLQRRPDVSLEMTSFFDDRVSDSELLGDDPSFRNAKSGKILEMTKGNRRGILAFEEVSKGVGAVRTILRQLAQNESHDRFTNEEMLLPSNVMVLTMSLTHDQYRFLSDCKKIDSQQLQSMNTSPSSKSEESSALWQVVNEFVLLKPLGHDELLSIINANLGHLEEQLATLGGLRLSFQGKEALMELMLQTTPSRVFPKSLMTVLTQQLNSVCNSLSNYDPLPTEMELACDPLPEYPHDLSRRERRGDYLNFRRVENCVDGKLQIRFTELKYMQQQRIDCGEYTIERPTNISFAELFGVDQAIAELRIALKYITGQLPAGCNADELTPPDCNFVLYGPPGTGKTSLACAAAREADVPVFFATGRMYRCPGKLGELFRTAQEMAPAIVVLEEFNSIGNSSNVFKRDDLNELLANVGGVNETGAKLLLIATTNHLEQIDPAALRPGRFGRHIRIGLPIAESRRRYALDFAGRHHLVLSEPELDEFVMASEGLSMAHLKAALGKALWLAPEGRRAGIEELRQALAMQMDDSAVSARIGF